VLKHDVGVVLLRAVWEEPVISFEPDGAAACPNVDVVELDVGELRIRIVSSPPNRISRSEKQMWLQFWRNTAWLSSVESASLTWLGSLGPV
jgi:hypothetical protein